MSKKRWFLTLIISLTLSLPRIVIAQDSTFAEVRSISGQDSMAIAKQLSALYRQFNTAEEESAFTSLFHDSVQTYIREDFHADPLLYKEKISPAEYFRKLNYLDEFYQVTDRQDTLNWEGNVWYKNGGYYSYFLFNETAEEYDYPISRGKVTKPVYYEKMARVQLYRDSVEGFFNQAKFLSVGAIIPDSLALYDSIRLHIDQVQRFIAFDTTSSDSIYYNFETRKLPHRVVVNTNILHPNATFTLFARYRKNGREQFFTLKEAVSATATINDGFFDRRVQFDLEEIPEQLIAMNQSEKNQPYRLEVQWDQNISVRRTSEQVYFFTRLLNFNRRAMADIYHAGEIVPKLSVADKRGEIYCYEASFTESSRSVGVRGRSPVAPVYKVDYFMDPATSLFDEIGESTFNGQVTLMESAEKDGTYVPASPDQFELIFKNTRGNGRAYAEGIFTIDQSERNPDINFDLKPLLNAVEALPGEPYPDKFFKFRITLENDSTGFSETTETPPFRINPPVRLPQDYHLVDRFFSNERKLLIADREKRFAEHLDNFDRFRKSVRITSPPDKNIADYDQETQLSIRVRNLSRNDHLLLKACTKKDCYTIREIRLLNKYPATYEKVVRLFDQGNESVERFNRFRKGTSEFLFENEVYFKVEMANITSMEMPKIGRKSMEKIYASHCKDNSFVNQRYAQRWQNWKKNNPPMTYSIVSDSTKSQHQIFPWLKVVQADAEIRKYIRRESRKKENYVPLKFTMLFPKTEARRRIRNVGVIAAVYYPDFSIRNVLLDVVEVTSDKITYELNLVERAADLNLGDRLNLNIWLIDYDKSVFSANPARMKWGNRKELILRETRLR
ncbi:MAG: hypothetical protein WBA74_12080 [Cyclobacteriaceae bacterium]